MLAVSLALGLVFLHQELEVVLLIQKMGDQHYLVRDEAHELLRNLLMSEEGERYRGLIESSTLHPDPEIARRCRQLTECFYIVEPSHYPATPWIDMLPPSVANRQEVIERYLQQARSGMNSWSGQDWPDYRRATHLYIRELLRQGYTRKQAQAVLNQMAEQEREYRSKRGMSDLRTE
jgi:hypothetical protein